MSGIRGFVTGVVGLSLLEAFLTSQTAPAGISGAAKLLAGGLGRWLDPTIPLIPNPAKFVAAGAAYTTTPPTAGTAETA